MSEKEQQQTQYTNENVFLRKNPCKKLTDRFLIDLDSFNKEVRQKLAQILYIIWFELDK